MPLTLRIVYHGFRATLRAGLILLVAWFLLIPSNAKERAVLNAAPGTKFPDGLRAMRTAQFVILVAPPRTYALIARVSGTDATPAEIEANLRNVAAGREGSTPQEEPFSARDIEGPRFIRVD